MRSYTVWLLILTMLIGGVSFFVTRSRWFCDFPSDLIIYFVIQDENGVLIEDAQMEFDEPLFQKGNLVKSGSALKSEFFVSFEGSVLLEGVSWELFFVIPFGERPPLLTCYFSNAGFKRASINLAEIFDEWRRDGRPRIVRKVVVLRKVA